MRLTRKKAIELCIALWEWLAETGKKKEDWPEWEKYKDCKGLNDAHWCWLCLYNNRKQRLPQSISECNYACPYYTVYGFCANIYARNDKPFLMWEDAKTPRARMKYAGLFLEQIKSLEKKKMMRWLTISQIKRRSKTAKGALEVSYEHWNQLYTATAKELRAKYKRTKGYIFLSTHCGLCHYYKRVYGNDMKCSHCVLGKTTIYRCGYGGGIDLWRHVIDAFEDWKKGRCNWRDWERTCKDLRDKLKELLEQGT